MVQCTVIKPARGTVVETFYSAMADFVSKRLAYRVVCQRTSSATLRQYCRLWRTACVETETRMFLTASGGYCFRKLPQRTFNGQVDRLLEGSSNAVVDATEIGAFVGFGCPVEGQGCSVNPGGFLACVSAKCSAYQRWRY